MNLDLYERSACDGHIGRFESVQNALAHVAGHERLLLAISGGGDSLAMLKWFAGQPRWRNQLVAAHVNHRMRNEAAQVADLAKQQAQDLGIQFVQADVDVPHAVSVRNESLEACARRLRYEALEQLRRKFDCCCIATAHTLDDDAETVFMKLHQASSWFECTGIPLRREHILRPFLSVSRSELRSLLAPSDVLDNDPMNSQLRFPRVRIRANLAQLGPGGSAIVERLAQHGRSLRRLVNLSERLLNASNNNILKKSIQPDFGLESLPKNLYLEDLDFLSVEVTWAKLLQGPGVRLPAATRRQITGFLRGTGRPSSLNLPHGVVLQRAGDKFWLSVTQFKDELRELQPFPDVIVTPQTILGKSSGLLEVSTGDWHVRVWRAGERFRPMKRRTRKISDWLADAGVHPALRNSWPVVCIHDHIVAVPGFGVCEKATPVSPETAVRIPWKAKSHLDQ